MATANDTFVESGGDVDLSAHTPTGANPGTSWVVHGGAGPDIDVIASTDLCQEANYGNGNRYRMTDDLGSDDITVQADFTFEVINWCAPGVLAKMPTDGGASVEFTFDQGDGGGGKGFYLSDGTVSDSSLEAWPGGTRTLKIVVNGTDIRGYDNGVEKCQITSSLFEGNTRAGIILLNFDGQGVSRITCDNYQSSAQIPIVGTTVWGHDTGVTETNVRDFSGIWTGTGAVSGSGDAEVIQLNATEYMESETVNTGSVTVTLLQNTYASGDTVTIQYRTGATQAACEAAAYSTYSAPFASDGFVGIKIVSTL